MCQEIWKVFKIAKRIVPDVHLTMNVRNGYKTVAVGSDGSMRKENKG